MAEPITTTLGLGAIGAYLAKDGIEKLLGPTAEYLGEGLKMLAEKRVQNIGRIFQSASNILGDKLEEPGKVPAKVLKTVINEGSYSEDTLAIEYFGGILASSRTELGRDDRGARIARILDGMSSYQIRAHYIIYNNIRLICNDDSSLSTGENRERLNIYFPYKEFISMMDFNVNEFENINSILQHIFSNLLADGLISNFAMGKAEDISEIYFQKFEKGGIVVSPAMVGGELFLWGFGYGKFPVDYLFSDNIECELDDFTGVISEARMLPVVSTAELMAFQKSKNKRGKSA